MAPFSAPRTLRLLSLWLAAVLVFPAYAQVVLPSSSYRVDETLKLIICNRPPIAPPGTTTLTLDKTYTLATPVDTFTLGTPYPLKALEGTYQLYFTQLPLIDIAVSHINDINREREIDGIITVLDTAGEAYTSAMGIRIRGATSSTFPKKSYRVQLRDDQGKNKDESIFGLRSDKRWLMLALYNEKLRLNNKLSHDLWLDMHRLYYADQEPEAHSTIRSRYVEAFVNNRYRGVYLFTENTDRKQLQLKKETDDGTVRGELYKGETWARNIVFDETFSVFPNDDYPKIAPRGAELWGGWELSYPDETDWRNLYDFTDFVIRASDEDFREQVPQKARLDNLADYFIFVNLLQATDNSGKNSFLARYKENEPYFYTVWDLDGTWGYHWTGQRNTNQGVPINRMVTNGLFDRLIATNAGNFNRTLTSRWFALREDLLSEEALAQRAERYYRLLKENGVYDRENRLRLAVGGWDASLLSYNENEFSYLTSWTRQRLAWLDDYFGRLREEYPLVAVASFTASAAEQSVLLEWVIEEDVEEGYFEIQHSLDSTSWQTIGELGPDAELGMSQTFSFVHENPAEGTNYYRLQMVTPDGQVSYSAVEAVPFELVLSWDGETARRIEVAPNPARHYLRLEVPAATTVQKVVFYRPNGLAVHQSTPNRDGHIDIRHLATGFYVLHITLSDGTVSTRKVLVQR